MLAARAPRISALTAHPDINAVLAQLQRILNSRIFCSAHHSQLFLRYIVEHGLARPGDPLKEYSVAADVFGRDAYDPAINNTVRVEAGRLRSRLLEYYAGEGRADPLLIEVPRGSYRAVVRARHAVAALEARPLALAPETALSAISSRRHRWAVLAAFLLGGFLGYRASR